MSFYTVIKTELKNRKYIIAALTEMRKRGEITECEIDRKGVINVDRSGDKVKIIESRDGSHELAGDNRVVQSLSNKLKQYYALESIKDNIPLDFEIASETETAEGEIKILLKG